MPIDEDILRMRDENIGLRAQLDEATYRASKAQLERDEAVRDLSIVSDSLDEVRVDLRQMTRERDSLLDLRVENKVLRRQIQAIHASHTWKIGRFLLAPVRLGRRLKLLFTRR